MNTLLPRLPRLAAEQLLEAVLDPSNGDWSFSNFKELPDGVQFAPTGGTPLSHEDLLALREAVLNIARRCGYGTEDSSAARRLFDIETSKYLADEPLFRSHEALRDDTWSFIGTALLPDVVRWRFGDTKDRYLGGPRNTFQRLWIRGTALDRGEGNDERWLLVSELPEDALVQLTERPSLCAERRVALAIGELFLELKQQLPNGEVEAAIRTSVVQALATKETLDLGGLGDNDLMSVLRRSSRLRNVME
jgi:hypothetical protein